MHNLILHFVMQNAMGLVLLLVLALLTIMGWQAQRDTSNNFNIWDLVMEAGKASRTGVAFMSVLVITSWVVITMALQNRLTETVFGIYCAAWVSPLVAKVIFNKSDMTPPYTGPQPKDGDRERDGH